MERKVHIQFHTNNVVTLTTFSRQKKIDLSDFKHEYIDLITFEGINNSDLNNDCGRFVAHVSTTYDDSGAMLLIQVCQCEGGRWKGIGSASKGQFNYGHTHSESNDGVFKTKVMD